MPGSQQPAETETEAAKAPASDQQLQAQKLESIGQLAAGIAHEINTPLQYVGDNTQFLKDSFGGLCDVLGLCRELLAEVKGAGAFPERVAALEQAMEDADLTYALERIPPAIEQSQAGLRNVAKIVRALREFSHPSLGERAPVDLNRGVVNTVTISRNEWKYHAEVETDLASDLPTVSCFGGEVNQVVLNIVVNAAHAIADANKSRGDSRARGTIRISTRRDGSWVEIRIADTGTGIPPAIRHKVFDPFFTTKEVGRGTGQGLALAHAIIVNKHKGTIHFETELGRGTTFVIRLPIGDAEGASA